MTTALVITAVFLGSMATMLAPFWVPNVIGYLVRPQPIVLLVCDMLRARVGWRDEGAHLTHPTGIVFYRSYAKASAQAHFELKIDRVPVKLNRGDRLRLWSALKPFQTARAAHDAEKAARLLAERSFEFAERARLHADNVVQMTKRDAA